MTGNAVFGNPSIQKMFAMGFGIEIVYSFVIIICSLMIYFGTKEIYELSSHKGIKYFRLAFLFFAFAYFFRVFIKLLVSYFNVQGILALPSRIFNPMVGSITLLFFMYFSAMAIFYLLYSVLWKRLEGNKFYLFHLGAVALAFFSIFSTNPFSYLGMNLFLLFFVIALVFVSYRDSKKQAKSRSHNLYVVYLLLLFFWIFNIINILLPKFLNSFQLLIYLSSLGVFLLISYKVLRKTGAS